MTTASMPRGVRMRPVMDAGDAFDAAAILAQAVTDDLQAVRDLVPTGTTPKPVEIAEDGTAALFDVYPGTEWDASSAGVRPIARILLRR